MPFEEDEKDPRTWFLDHNYVEAMNDMFKKVNGAPASLFQEGKEDAQQGRS